MSFKKFDDNFNSIIKSLRPIKDKFSKQSFKHDEYFKKSSFETLEKNLNGPKKSPETFYTSKLYRNLDYMYNLSNDSYDYIANLKGIKNIPINVNKKGYFIKNLYNPEFERKPEEKYFYSDNKKNYIYDLNQYKKNKKIFKFAVYALDPGYYHPNYNFVKKRIPIIDFSKSKNSHEKSEFAKIAEEAEEYNSDYLILDNKEQINDKIIDKNNLNEENKFIDINILKNDNDNENNLEKDITIKNKSIKEEKLDNKDNSRNDFLNKKEKFKNSIKLRFPKIMRKSNSQTISSTPVMISFKKMIGRDDVKKENNLLEKTDIEYKPNYDFRLPHVRSFQFKSKRNKQNHKKYIVGKILRSYSFNSYGYFVMDIKKNK